MKQYLLSPDLWIYGSSGATALGIPLMIVGMVFDTSALWYFGIALCGPLIIGAVGICLFAIPTLIIGNLRNQNEGEVVDGLAGSGNEKARKKEDKS